MNKWPRSKIILVQFQCFKFDFSEFDREKKSEYSFEVYATDSGLYGPRTTSVRVDIDISDVNDNAPIFDEIPFRADISQNHGRGQYVTQVSKRDLF